MSPWVRNTFLTVLPKLLLMRRPLYSPRYARLHLANLSASTRKKYALQKLLCLAWPLAQFSLLCEPKMHFLEMHCTVMKTTAAWTACSVQVLCWVCRGQQAEPGGQPGLPGQQCQQQGHSVQCQQQGHAVSSCSWDLCRNNFDVCFHIYPRQKFQADLEQYTSTVTGLATDCRTTGSWRARRRGAKTRWSAATPRPSRISRTTRVRKALATAVVMSVSSLFLQATS